MHLKEETGRKYTPGARGVRRILIKGSEDGKEGKDFRTEWSSLGIS